jgi:hypothetical protein
MPRTKKEATTQEEVVKLFRELDLESKVEAYKQIKTTMEWEKNEADANLKKLTDAVK